MVMMPKLPSPVPAPKVLDPKFIRKLELPNTADQAAHTVIDSDGSGKVNKDEWKASGSSEDRMKAFDADGSGEVDQKEYLESRKSEREFNEMDKDGDGQLSEEEMGPDWNSAIFKGLGAIDGIEGKVRCLPPFEKESRHEKFDTDNDGKVSRNEYVAGENAEKKKPGIQINPWPGNHFPPTNPFPPGNQFPRPPVSPLPDPIHPHPPGPVHPHHDGPFGHKDTGAMAAEAAAQVKIQTEES